MKKSNILLASLAVVAALGVGGYALLNKPSTLPVTAPSAPSSVAPSSVSTESEIEEDAGVSQNTKSGTFDETAPDLTEGDTAGDTDKNGQIDSEKPISAPIDLTLPEDYVGVKPHKDSKCKYDGNEGFIPEDAINITDTKKPVENEPGLVNYTLPTGKTITGKDSENLVYWSPTRGTLTIDPNETYKDWAPGEGFNDTYVDVSKYL